MLIGTVEFGRLIILAQKLQNGTFVLADLAARDETLSVAQLDNMFLAVDNILQPFEVAGTTTAFVSSVTVEDDGDPMINWQRQGVGTLGVFSEIGTTGNVAALPANVPLNIGETIIVSEVFYSFEPFFAALLEPSTLRRVAFAKPRLGTLDSLAP
jgi:Flp pilus assembly protein TadG